MDGPVLSRREPNSTHKTMRQKLERMESTVSALPQALSEYLDSFNSYCLSGIKLASLLETLFQETPILLVALRFREACEQLSDKCNKSGVLQKQEIVGPVKRLAPALSKLRSQVESHAKTISKHESYLKQLEQLRSAQHPKKEKIEHVETKFHASAEDFAKEDSQLAEALNELHQLRVEVMGSCFLSFLDGQSKLLNAASDIMAPLGAYKEVGKGLNNVASSSKVKEATVGWLAAAQVNQNLRSFGGLSRNDVQCMLYNSSDGLPGTIRVGLNQKVNQLLKTYATELQKTPNPHHKVTGGFHLNPKGIEMALRDCCSELEARGAGAPHAQTRAEKEEQITRDVSRTSYKIGESTFGCAMGEKIDDNIKQKMMVISELISELPLCSQLHIAKDTIDEFAFQILNESCTTVTNTAAKTAVQLIFGKANLVLVRPSSSAEDNSAVEISSRAADSSIQITVNSSWWLVEDYAAFAMLSRPMDPNSLLGIVDTMYTINLTLQNFIREDSPAELPAIAVTYRQPTSSYSPNLSASHKDKDKFLSLNRTAVKIKTLIRQAHGHASMSRSPVARSPKQPSFQSYVDIKESKTDEEDGILDRSEELSRRKASSGSDGSGSSLNTLREYSRTDSFTRNMRPSYHYPLPGSNLRRTGSSETVSSQSTLVQKPSFYETDDSSMGITDFLLPSESHHGGLTQSRIRAFTERSEGGRLRYDRKARGMYDYQRGRKGVFSGKQEHEEEQDPPRDDGLEQQDPRQRGTKREGVSIASDTEVQSVIAFLSRSPYPDSEDPYEGEFGFDPQAPPPSSSSRGQEDYSYPARYGYPARDYANWVRGGENTGRNGGERKSQSGENSSSGSSGIDDPFGRGEPLQYMPEALRSRSASDSDPREGEFGLHNHLPQGDDINGDDLVANPHCESVDSGIHLHGGGGKKQDRPLPATSRTEREAALKENRRSQELSFDLNFTKGFGPLIPSDRHQGFGMEMLRDGPDYKLGLEMYKTISDSDSDEHSGVSSGRDSIPLISSSSSGSQSPVLGKTRSEENIRALENERSLSRTSTHSMPMPPYAFSSRGSTLSLNEIDLAPGSKPRQYPDFGDRLSQDSDGGRGSLSQGSIGLRDPMWEMERDYHMRRHRPFEYDIPRTSGYQFNEPPPPPPPMSREPRPQQRNPRGRMYNDYSPGPPPPPHDYSPGPPHDFDHRHGPPMMPPGPGPGYWSGYEHGYERARANSVGPLPHPVPHPMPPPPGHNPGGPMPGPMHDKFFRPVVSFRPNTPSDAPSPASMHSMSPAPSPRPTPPPTPPPMGPPHPHPHPSPIPPRGLPPPHMHNPGPPHMHPAMGPPHMPPGHHPHMPHLPHGPRDFPPPMPPRGPHLPPPPPIPSPNMVGPPVSMHGRYPHPPPDWDRGWHHYQ